MLVHFHLICFYHLLLLSGDKKEKRKKKKPNQQENPLHASFYLLSIYLKVNDIACYFLYSTHRNNITECFLEYTFQNMLVMYMTFDMWFTDFHVQTVKIVRVVVSLVLEKFG